MFTSLLTSVLLATAALARPNPRLETRLARRTGSHMSSPRQPSTGPAALASNVTNAEFSSNWAGASFESPAGTYKAVTSTFVVPTAAAPNGGSGTFTASAWVGIDGNTCGSAILQTGIDHGYQRPRFVRWQVHPDKTFGEAEINTQQPGTSTSRLSRLIAAGNTIKLTTTVASAAAGTVTIEIVSTGVTVSQSLTSSARLCQENAEWIVEDFEEGNSLVPFANFKTVTFTNAVATLASGGTVGPTGAVLIDIEQNGQVLTSLVESRSATFEVHQ